jgi:hypothetical protein
LQLSNLLIISNYTTLESFPAFSVVHFDIKPQNIVKQTITFLLQTFCNNEEHPSKGGSGTKEVSSIDLKPIQSQQVATNWLY